MNELRALATELCLTLSLDSEEALKQGHQLPITLELEGLSRKLQFLKSYLSSVHNLIVHTPAEQQLLQEATVTLSSASEVRTLNICVIYTNY